MFLAETTAKTATLFGMSIHFWIVMILMVLFIVAILTASYNDDKTKGL